MRVLCVDDHVIFRQGVRQILARMGPALHFAEASTAEEMMQILGSEEWDVVLLDVSLPDSSGLDLVMRVHQKWPDVPVVVLTMHQDEEYAIRALRNGAAAYVTKDTAPADLLAAISRVREGGTYISPPVAEKMAMSLATGRASQPHERLSPREMEVLRMIGEGKSLKEISVLLSLSVKSVGTYRSRVLEKMNLSSNAELVRYLVEHRLLP